MERRGWRGEWGMDKREEEGGYRGYSCAFGHFYFGSYSPEFLDLLTINLMVCFEVSFGIALVFFLLQITMNVLLMRWFSYITNPLHLLCIICPLYKPITLHSAIKNKRINVRVII